MMVKSNYLRANVIGSNLMVFIKKFKKKIKIKKKKKKKRIMSNKYLETILYG